MCRIFPTNALATHAAKERHKMLRNNKPSNIEILFKHGADVTARLELSPEDETFQSFIWSRLFAQLSEGLKIHAIKTYRDFYGCTLLEAKRAIEMAQRMLAFSEIEREEASK